MAINNQNISNNRSTYIKVLLILIVFIFAAKLFYLQILKYDYYKDLARSEHEKKFEISPVRGIIYARDGQNKVPFVLNENKPTIYADTRYIKDPSDEANKLAEVLKLSGEQISGLKESFASGKPYIVIQKKISNEINNAITDLTRKGQLPGIGISDVNYRLYTQGSLAAHIIGFANDEGIGQYGIEAQYDTQLSGETGLLRAVTDINGIPLAANDSTLIKAMKPGQNLNLTIDINIQRQLEEVMAKYVVDLKAEGGSSIIMNTANGEIVAMANNPTFDPGKYAEITDYSTYINNAISATYEPGSIMKIFTMAAGLNEGAITPTTSYYDSNSTIVEDRQINNSYNWGAGNRNMPEVLKKSLNTGVVYILRQLGGGIINEQAREKLHKYFVENFELNSLTGIDIPNESNGYIAGINTGAGDNVRYANMAFGQGLTTTPIQILRAFSAIAGDGHMVKPHVLEGASEIGKLAVRSETAAAVRSMMVFTAENVPLAKAGYEIGGKSGTAQMSDGKGGYDAVKTNDSYIAFVNGADEGYIMLTWLRAPAVGQGAINTAALVVKDMMPWLINYENILPKN